MKISPDSIPNDQLLELTVIKQIIKMEIIIYFWYSILWKTY